MRIDVSAFVGAYPWRRVPGTSVDAVLAAMDRAGIDEAWISHLPGVFWRDPMEGNAWLLDTVLSRPRLRAVPAVHPGLPHWEETIRDAAGAGAPAVRADPTWYGIDPVGSGMQQLAQGCAQQRMPLMLTVRFEDGRQRHPNDRADELPPWAVRALVRSHPALRLVVTHADRAFIEEVHFGATPEEASRIWWDITWIWGPPEDHLATLLETVGSDRFVFGTGQPLRLPETSVAKLDLLDLDADRRARLEADNIRALAAR